MSPSICNYFNYLVSQVEIIKYSHILIFLNVNNRRLSVRFLPQVRLPHRPQHPPQLNRLLRLQEKTQLQGIHGQAYQSSHEDEQRQGLGQEIRLNR